VSFAFANNTILYLTSYIYVNNVVYIYIYVYICMYIYICVCCIDISDYWICGRSGVSYHLLERRARSMVLEHEDKISHPYNSFVRFCCAVLGCSPVPSIAASAVLLYDNAFPIPSICFPREKPECHR